LKTEHDFTPFNSYERFASVQLSSKDADNMIDPKDPHIVLKYKTVIHWKGIPFFDLNQVPKRKTELCLDEYP